MLNIVWIWSQGHRSVSMSPFTSAGAAVFLLGAKTVMQRPLLTREVETRFTDCGVTR